MKPFDLKLAKEGHPVCTSDGRDVEILRFNIESSHPILALVKNHMVGGEYVSQYTIDGKRRTETDSNLDLFMQEKKEKKCSCLKLFNLELAKAGHPVCTKNGEKVQIISFNGGRKNFPIVGRMSSEGLEFIMEWTNTGVLDGGEFKGNPYDLFLECRLCEE